jgi:hypothetical protein
MLVRPFGGHDDVVSRHPGETTEQWNVRATAEYRNAWEAFSVQRRRILQAGFLNGDEYPLLDEEYDAAMDRLEAADTERDEATVALVGDHRKMAGDTRRRVGTDAATDDPAGQG